LAAIPFTITQHADQNIFYKYFGKKSWGQSGQPPQGDLPKEAGVSREVIGRYERNEVSPSVDVAKKIADALEVSLDYLAGGSDKVAFDKQTLKLIDEIEELEPSTKDKLIFLANAIIRDAKTGKAYAH
jgi:transcriptional regulator with XRE-family HTH domain